MKKGIVSILKTKIFKGKSIKSIGTKPNNLAHEKIHEVETRIEFELNALASLSDIEKQKINEDVKKMIDYYQSMTEQIETRRSKLVDGSWQTLTILITAAGLLLAARVSLWFLLPALFIFLVQIVFAIAKIIENQVQSKFRYPFLNSPYSNKWKWFYYGNPFIKSINFDPFKKENGQSVLAYLNGLSYFIRQYREETIDFELSNNIQQLYLLQIHNGYKNQFFLRHYKYDYLANIISFWFLSIIGGVIVGFYFYTWFLS